MIKFEHFAFTKRYWEFYKASIISWRFAIDVCKWLGGFWLVIEPLSYFSTQFETLIKPFGLHIFGVSILFTIIQNRPRLKFKYFIKDKDVYVNIVIGDLLKNKRKDIIIPTNVHFITELSDNLISEKSVQGQFTRMYYDSYNHLDTDIQSSLTSANFTEENPNYLGKDKKYDLGTVARLSIKKDNKRLFWVYLFALAKLNEHGVCQSNIGEFQQTLPSLWSYIQTKGELSDLSLPILGSGFCRIDSSREDLFKEILLSFLAATRNSKFCKSLTFVLYYRDVSEMNIDIDSIKEFTRFHTSNFSRESNRNNTPQQGQAIN
ncbi:MAG: macro domain-containing protein [Sediminibacterium sp.]